MRKAVKVLLLLLAATIIIFSAAAGFIMLTFDKQDYCEALTTTVREFTDYQLEIIEPLTTDISIRPSFSAAAVKIFIPGKPTPLEIRKFRLKLTLAALLKKHLQANISGVINSQPSLNLVLPEELSAVESLTLATRVATNGSELKLSNLRLKATNKQGLNIKADGHGLIEDFSAPQPFKKLDLKVKISSPDSRTFRGYMPDDLPELGKLQGSLRLVAVSNQELAARKINFLCRRDAGELETRVGGEISRIPVDPDKPNSDIDLKLELYSPSTLTVNEFISQPLPEIGPVRITARIRESKKELSVEELELHTGNSGALEIKAGGRLKFKESDSKTEPALDEIDLKCDISAPAGTRLPDFSGSTDNGLQVPDNGPLRATFTLKGNPEKINFDDFSTHFGQTVITAGLEVILSGKRPYLSGNIHAQSLNLHDFAISSETEPKIPDAAAQKPPEPKKTETAKPDRSQFFSPEPLPWELLHLIDCDLKLTIDEIVGRQDREGISDLNFTVKLKAGRLLADPAALVYKSGRAEFSLLIDDTDPASAPRVELKGDVKDLELEGLLETLALDLQVSGKLTARTEINSRGRSPADLAVNLNGPFEVVLEKGKVPSQIMKLIAIDILGWSFDKILMQKRSTEIGCGILALDTRQGLLKVKAFILESPDLLITGAGTVNLKDEACDLTIYPKKKRKFLAMVNPVNIRGPLQDPQVIAIPVKSAALLYGGALLAPQIFLPAIGLDYLWGKVSKDSKDKKSPCFEYLHKKKYIR